MVLVMIDGSVASLVAAWREQALVHQKRSGDVARPVLWLDGPDAALMGPRAEALMAVTGFDVVVAGSAEQWLAPEGTAPRTEGTLRLMRACLCASQRGIARVVWPVHTTPAEGVEAAARAFDRALLTEQLLGLDLAPIAAVKGAQQTDSPSLHIETPMLEISDEALMDIASELGVPVELAAFCRESPGPSCGQCPSCRRWKAAGQQVGYAFAIAGQ